MCLLVGSFFGHPGACVAALVDAHKYGEFLHLGVFPVSVEAKRKAMEFHPPSQPHPPTHQPTHPPTHPPTDRPTDQPIEARLDGPLHLHRLRPQLRSHGHDPGELRALARDFVAEASGGLGKPWIGVVLGLDTPGSCTREALAPQATWYPPLQPWKLVIRKILGKPLVHFHHG